MLIKLSVSTTQHTQMLDITDGIRKAVEDSGIRDGICTVFIPHTTAAVTINENADPDVVRDFTTEINKLVPWEDGYRHMEGNSAAHLKASMSGFSQQIIIDGGRLLLIARIPGQDFLYMHYLDDLNIHINPTRHRLRLHSPK